MRRRTHRSHSSRSFPNGLNSGVVTSGQIRAGASSMNPSGTRHQPPAIDHHRAAVLVGRGNQLVGKADPPAEIHGPGRLADEVVGAVLDQIAVAPLGFQDAAEAVARFQQQ